MRSISVVTVLLFIIIQNAKGITVNSNIVNGGGGVKMAMTTPVVITSDAGKQKTMKFMLPA